MATTTVKPVGLAGMPRAGSSRAPYYSGRPEDLKKFFEEFEELADGCQLTDAQKAKAVVRYTKPSIETFWEALGGYSAGDYAALKKSIMDTNPRAEKAQRYSISKLESIRRKASHYIIDSESDFYDYFTKFWPVAHYLKTAQVLTDDQVNYEFWRGIHKQNQRQIIAYMPVINTNYTKKKPPTIDEVKKAVAYLWSEDAFDVRRKGREDDDEESESSSEESSSEEESDDEDHRRRRRKARKAKKTVTKEVETKTVRFEKPKTAGTSGTTDGMDELSKKLQTMKITDANYTAAHSLLVALANLTSTPHSSVPGLSQPQQPLPPTAQSYPNRPSYGSPPPPSSYPPRSNTYSSVPPPQRNPWLGSTFGDILCFFCKGKHRLNVCPVLQRYLALGRVIQVEGRVCWPDIDTSTNTPRLIYFRNHPQGCIQAVVDERFGPVEASDTPASASAATSTRDTPPHLNKEVSSHFYAVNHRDTVETMSGTVVAEVIEEEFSDDEGEIIWEGAVELDRLQDDEGLSMVVTRAGARAARQGGDDDDDEEEDQPKKKQETKKMDGEALRTQSEESKKKDKEESRRKEKEKEPKEKEEPKKEELKKEWKKQPSEQKSSTKTTQPPFPAKPSDKFTPRPPAFAYESKIANPKIAGTILDKILDRAIPDITARDLLGLSGDLRKEFVETCKVVRVPTTASSNLLESTAASTYALTLPSPLPAIEYSTPLRQLDNVLVNGSRRVPCVLDNGSEIVAVAKELWDKMRFDVNPRRNITMKMADGRRDDMGGCAEFLEMEVDGIRTWAHAYVVPNAPYQILLGRPWHRLVRLLNIEDDDGVDVIISDPLNRKIRRVVKTSPRKDEDEIPLIAMAATVHSRSGKEDEKAAVPLYFQKPSPDSRLAEALLRRTHVVDPVSHCLVYKKVANKVKPIPTTMPEKFKVIRRIPEDPLLTLPPLSLHPPPFTPGKRLTQERLDAMRLDENTFINDAERAILVDVLRNNENALAWTDNDGGCFSEAYFPPLVIPTIAHIPWSHKNRPMAPGMVQRMIPVLERKLEAGVVEESTSSYSCRWFGVNKKGTDEPRIVFDHQPLNGVTIKDSSQLPLVDAFAENCCGRGILTMADMYSGFDHIVLAEESRDCTSFDTPLGKLRLTRGPQGCSNLPGIFNGHVAFLLRKEKNASNFCDDVIIFGEKTRYETEDGGYETMPGNPEVRRFVGEHLEVLNRVLHRMAHAGGTFAVRKLRVAQPEIIAVGQRCSYEGRLPELVKIKKVETWKPCTTTSEVRGFLGMAGTVRIWVEGFAEMAKPLVELTKKDVEFSWGEKEQQAMDALKQAIIKCPAIRPIDYTSDNPVILAVDSSNIACGYILLQLDDEERRRPCRFGSIAWNAREARYSQAKIELYGVFRAIHAVKFRIIGVKQLIIEVDAKYIKGMLNNPDEHPNAAMNRWIAAINLFDFKLVHVPAAKHKGPDGLSRRSPTEGDDEEVGEDAEEWADDVLDGGMFMAARWKDVADGGILLKKNDQMVLLGTVENGEGRQNDGEEDADLELRQIQDYLTTLRLPDAIPQNKILWFQRRASQFFIHGERLWHRDRGGHHQLVAFAADRARILQSAHDHLGHRGFYPTRQHIADRFWWPKLDNDIKTHIQTCHECQIRSGAVPRPPPVLSEPAKLFRKVHVDTMILPLSEGYRYVVQARCNLSGWVEHRELKKENARTIGKFIFEDILCRWGVCEEIVSDNGTPYVAALDYLSKKYGVRHIRISPYNSQANGIVERSHKTIRGALVKACEGDISKWYQHIHHIFWADRITTRRSLGYSPFYVAHGVEPHGPLDLLRATFLHDPVTSPLSDADLLALRAQQFCRRDDDLAIIEQRVLKARFGSILDFEKKHKNSIDGRIYQPGELVLVSNKKIEPEVGQKCKPKYLGPLVVVSRSAGGSYRLAEVNGVVSKLKFGASRLIPYYSRSNDVLKVTRFLRAADLNADAEA